MTTNIKSLVAAGGAALLLLGGAAGVVGSQALTEDEATPSYELVNCDGVDHPIPLEVCAATGILRDVFYYNLQGASQFCVWKKANPGEWRKLREYAQGSAEPYVITWFAGAIRDSLKAYFEAGGAPFTIAPNTSPNICRTPLAPPSIGAVTPGSDKVEVEIIPPGG